MESCAAFRRTAAVLSSLDCGAATRGYLPFACRWCFSFWRSLEVRQILGLMGFHWVSLGFAGLSVIPVHPRASPCMDSPCIPVHPRAWIPRASPCIPVDPRGWLPWRSDGTQ
eukprot:gene18520-biopygen14494